MMKTVFLLLLGLVFLCKGLKGDENENEDAIVLDEDDDEIPNELDEIKYKATAEAEDPGHCRMPNCRGLKRKRRCRCRRRRCICRVDSNRWIAQAN